MRTRSQLLAKGETILDTYTIEAFLGEGAFGEVYRVRHRFMGAQALKVFKAEVSAHTDLETLASEARILSKLTHPSIVRVFETNTFVRGGISYVFLTMGFVIGESLAQLLGRKTQLAFVDAVPILMGTLEGLAYAHSQQPPVVHRDISPDNIMISYSEERPKALLSDFGLAMQADLNETFLRPAGKYLFMAPECFFRTYLPGSDVFSAGLVFYRTITGTLPWQLDSSARFGNSSALETGVFKARKNPPIRPSELCPECPSSVERVLLKALALDVQDRYRNAPELLDALRDALSIPDEALHIEPPRAQTEEREGSNPQIEVTPRDYSVRRVGKGFDEISGMHELKELLYNDVILPLKDKALYEEYQVSVPNGFLFYGPPGCGKTFIAQKFAKEVGYQFIELKPSDIASIYVHGTQEKIGEIFKTAELNAPTLLFIDEIDAVVPRREGNLAHSYSSEVNEFLVQMTECHKRGIFIIAATNRPERVDAAILRTGRLDKIFYLGPPDQDARREMIIDLLGGRPIDEEFDAPAIAEATELYVASDIAFLVNEAAREALRERAKIGTEHFNRVLSRVRPSVSRAQIDAYKNFANVRSFD